MYLTDRRNDVHRQLSDHEELELLLETFSKQVEEIVNEAENIHVCGTLLPLTVGHRSYTCRTKEQRSIDARDSRAYSRLE
jgi:hypothetical protein